MLPEQVRLPVAPSIVQPVAPEPPAMFTLEAVAPPGPIASVVAAPAKFTVVGTALTRLNVVAVVPIVPPLTFRFPPSVKRPVPVVMARFVAVLRLSVPVPVMSMTVELPARLTDEPLIVVVPVPVVKAPAPVMVTESPALVGESTVPVRFHQPWLPVPPMLVIVPEQVRLSVAPSIVQPVAPEPPAMFTLVAAAPPGPMDSVVAAPPMFRVVAF